MDLIIIIKNSGRLNEGFSRHMYLVSGHNIEVVEFQELIEEVRVQLIGPIRQEILSGVKRKQQFSELKKYCLLFLTYHLPQKTLN